MENVDRALKNRAAIIQSSTTNCCRLLHSAKDGVDGLVVEKFGPVLVAQMHEGQLRIQLPQVRAVCEHLMHAVGATSVYQKTFPRDRSHSAAILEAGHHNAQPWIGAICDEEFAVVENGLRYRIRPYDGFSVGLFLEQRENRALVRRSTNDLRVLNLFAYTCAFGVAAGIGGAAECVNVDVSKRYLEWGRRNLAENGIDLERQRFILSDVFEYLDRARRQQRWFDFVILDPPSFGRDKSSGAVFSIRQDLPRLIDECLERLNPDGMLLIATNHRPTLLTDLIQYAQEAAVRHHRSVEVERLSIPADFAGDADYAKTVLATFDGQ